MENNYKLYIHICPNGKKYYGITKQEPKRRWQNGHGYKHNQYFSRAIEKYGWDNIEHLVLFDSLSEYEAKELERYMIQWYNTTDPQYGYNISTGGEGNTGCVRTDEWNKKISDANKGKSVSNETKKKISDKMKGRQFSDEHKKKISESSKGKKAGKNNPMYGRTGKSNPMYGRTGKNNPTSRKVIRTDTNEIFESITQASQSINGNHKSLSKALKRGTKYKGIEFKYYE